MTRVLALFALLLLQDPAPTGTASFTISGRILLADGAPAAGVRVSALDGSNATPGESMLIRLAQTDDNGRYVLEDVPAGRYLIVAGLLAQPTYFPGVVDRALAFSVTVPGGSLGAVNFSIVAPLTAPAGANRNVNNNNNNTSRRPAGGSTTCGNNGNLVNRAEGVDSQNPKITADRAGAVYFALGSQVQRVTPDGKVTRVAGTGRSGFSGDGGLATAAELGAVKSLAMDSAGNLYIAEEPARVRKVTPDGVISTVAGNGMVAVGGDGGAAIASPLCPITGFAVDGAGNIFIASGLGVATDSWYPGDYRIRKIDRAGVITTVAGDGVPPGSSAIPPGTPATTVGMWVMTMAADASGNLYIAGTGGISKLTPDGKLTPINNDRAVAQNVSSLVIDGTGTLFLALRDIILRRTTDGVVTTFAGNGTRGWSGEGVPAATSSLSMIPVLRTDGSGLGMDGAGNLFVAEMFSSAGNPATRRIRKVTRDGVLSTVYTIPSLSVSGHVASALERSAYAEFDFAGAVVPALPQGTLYLVRHTSSGPPAPVNLPVRRYPVDSPADGRFEIPSIARGSYELFASLPDIHGWDTRPPGQAIRPVAFGRATFDVFDAAAQVTVTVRPGVDLNGKVTVDGRPAAAAGLKIHLKPDTAAAAVEYYRTVSQFVPAIGADGTFLFPALPAAQYEVEVEVPAGLELADILLGGKSVAGHAIPLGAASTGPLEVVLKTAAR